MAHGSEVEKLERRWMENPLGVTFAPLAEAYRRAGDHPRALEVLAAGLLNHPAYVPALIVQARCHLDLREDQPAEASFRSVIEGDPHNLIALKGLADICERGSRTAEALTFLDRLLEADPTHDEARAQATRLAASVPLPVEAPVEAPADTSFLPDPEPGAELEGVEIGIEREEGPFDDFDPAEWSGAALGTDIPSDLPFEEAGELGSVASPGRSEEPGLEAPARVPEEQDPVEVPGWQEVSHLEPEPEPELETGSDLLETVAELPESEVEAVPLPPAGLEAAGFTPWEALQPETPVWPELAGEAVLIPETSELTGEAGGEEWRSVASEHDGEEAGEDAAIIGPTETTDHQPALEEAEGAVTWGAPEGVEAAPDEEVQNLGPVAADAGSLSEAEVGVPIEEEPVAVVEGAAAEADQDAPPAEIEPELVITETMARVFERQGHHTMALAVYAQLLQREPGNDLIRAAVSRLKAELAPAGAGEDSIGQFLARQIEPPAAAPENPAPPVASLDAPPTSAAAEPVKLGAIFGPPRPATARDSGEDAESGPSFDEFFAGTTGEPAGGRPPSEDQELEQFSAWLRTLKH
jgi:tetratricopeptide (TPR) repeat protein